MAKTTHKQKVKMARNGRNNLERKTKLGGRSVKTSIWDTRFWNARKEAIAARVKRTEARRAKSHV